MKMKIECKRIGVNGFGEPVYQTTLMTHTPRRGLSARQAEERCWGDGEILAATGSDGYETCVGDEARRALGWELQ